MAYTGPLQFPTLPTNYGSGQIYPSALGQIGATEANRANQPQLPGNSNLWPSVQTPMLEGAPSGVPQFSLPSGVNTQTGVPNALGALGNPNQMQATQTIPTSMNWPGFIYGNPLRNPSATGGGTPLLTGQNPLAAGPVSGYNPAYGGIPSAPNPVGTGADAIAGNLANLGRIYNLATGSSSASAAGALTQLNQNLPGASGALSTGLGNTMSLLGGNIDPLALAQYQEDAAQRGVNIGAPGSPNVDAGYLRGLGLTRLGLQQQGLSNLGSLIGMTPTGPKFDPSSMQITPAQQQLAQLLSNYLAAAPNPTAARNADLNSLLSGLNRGQAAGTHPQDPFAAAAAAFPPINPASLGFGFGTLGKTGATLQGPLGAALASSGAATGPSDPSQDPSLWMSPQDLQTWDAMSPDQQYEEALMGYPSFTSDQSVTVPGSESLDTSGDLLNNAADTLPIYEGDVTDTGDNYG